MLESHFAPLLIIIFLAFLVPVLLSRFKQLHLPIVVGEILVGIRTTNAAFDYSTLLVLMAPNPTVYELSTRTDDQKEVYEIVVENVTRVGKTFNQLNLSGDILVLALRRNGELFVPHGNTTIEACDHLTLFSSLKWVDTGHMLFSELTA